MKLHSVTDLITNSSSTIYSFPDNVSIEDVVNIVEQLKKTINELAGKNIEFNKFVELCDKETEQYGDNIYESSVRFDLSYNEDVNCDDDRILYTIAHKILGGDIS